MQLKSFKKTLAKLLVTAMTLTYTLGVEGLTAFAAATDPAGKITIDYANEEAQLEGDLEGFETPAAESTEYTKNLTEGDFEEDGYYFLNLPTFTLDGKIPVWKTSLAGYIGADKAENREEVAANAELPLYVQGVIIVDDPSKGETEMSLYVSKDDVKGSNLTLTIEWKDPSEVEFTTITVDTGDKGATMIGDWATNNNFDEPQGESTAYTRSISYKDAEDEMLEITLPVLTLEDNKLGWESSVGGTFVISGTESESYVAGNPLPRGAEKVILYDDATVQDNDMTDENALYISYNDVEMVGLVLTATWTSNDVAITVDKGDKSAVLDLDSTLTTTGGFTPPATDADTKYTKTLQGSDLENGYLLQLPKLTREGYDGYWTTNVGGFVGVENQEDIVDTPKGDPLPDTVESIKIIDSANIEDATDSTTFYILAIGLRERAYNKLVLTMNWDPQPVKVATVTVDKGEESVTLKDGDGLVKTYGFEASKTDTTYTKDVMEADLDEGSWTFVIPVFEGEHYTFENWTANVDGTYYDDTTESEQTLTAGKPIPAGIAAITIDTEEKTVDTAGELHFLASALTGGLKLTASWTAVQYTVTLDPGDGTIDSSDWAAATGANAGRYTQTVNYNTSVTLPDPELAEDSDLVFSHWENTSHSKVTSPVSVTADVTLTAVYAKQHTVAQNADGWTIPENEFPSTFLENAEALAGEGLVLFDSSTAALQPTKSGYTFKGWAVQAEQPKTDNLLRSSIETEDVDLIAVDDAVTNSAKKIVLKVAGNADAAAAATYSEGVATITMGAETLTGYGKFTLTPAGVEAYNITVDRKNVDAELAEDATLTKPEAQRGDGFTAPATGTEYKKDIVSTDLPWELLLPEFELENYELGWKANVKGTYGATDEEDRTAYTAGDTIKADAIAVGIVASEADMTYDNMLYFLASDVKTAQGLKLEAIWTLEKRTVTLSVEGGDIGATDKAQWTWDETHEVYTKTVDHGTKVTLPTPTPEDSDYDFYGWFEGFGQLVEETENIPVTEDLNFVAVYAKNHTVEYVWGDWTAPNGKVAGRDYVNTFSDANEDLLENDGLVLIDSTETAMQPTRSGFTFRGWQVKAVKAKDGAPGETEEIIYVNEAAAQSVQGPKKVVIKVDDGATQPASEILNGTFTLTVDPDTLETYGTFTLTPAGVEAYNVTVDLGDANANLKTATALTGQNFTAVAQTTTYKKDVLSNELPASINLPELEYDIHHAYTWQANINGAYGGVNAPKNYAKDTKIDVSKVAIVATAEAMTADDTLYFLGSAVKAAGGLTLKAVWTTNSYTITLKTGAGTIAEAGWTKVEDGIYTRNFQYTGDEITLPDATPGAAADNVEFIGWLDADETPVVDGEVLVTKAAEFTAVYQTAHTVRYDLGGGSWSSIAESGRDYQVVFYEEDDTLTATAGHLIVNSNAGQTPPERKGYAFKGWIASFAKAAGGSDTVVDGAKEAKVISVKTTAGDAAASYNDDLITLGAETLKTYRALTLTAVWEAEEYQITYNLDGGALANGESNPTTYTVETESFTLKNPTRAHYTFAGWTGTGLQASTKAVTVEKGTIGLLSFVATWTPVPTNTVRIELVGGQFSNDDMTALTQLGYHDNSITVQTDDPPLTIPNPTKAGHVFKGWTVQVQGQAGTSTVMSYTTSNTIEANTSVILSANWDQIDLGKTSTHVDESIKSDDENRSLNQALDAIASAAQDDNSEVVVDMAVTEVAEADARDELKETLESVYDAAGGADAEAEIETAFVSIDVTQYVTDNSGDTETTEIYDLGRVVELPYTPTDATLKANLDKLQVVVREHLENGVPQYQSFQQLSSKPASDFADARFYVDAADGKVYIYTRYFSTYGFGYQTNSYDVTFDAAGGTAVAALTNVNSITSLPTTTRTNYTFKGWFYADGTTQAAVGDLITSDTTLTAKWTPVSSGPSRPVNPGAGGGSGSGSGDQDSDPNKTVSPDDVNQEQNPGEQTDPGTSQNPENPENPQNPENPEQPQNPDQPTNPGDQPTDTPSDTPAPAVAEPTTPFAQAVLKKNGKVQVKWDKVPGATSYVIMKAVSGNQLEEAGQVAAKKKKFTLTGFESGKMYNIQVVAKVGSSDTKSTIMAVDLGTHTNATKVKTNKSSFKLKTGGTATITATLKGKGSIYGGITFTSLNESIATVDSKGVVTAKAPGKTYVYASAANGVKKKVKIRVK